MARTTLERQRKAAERLVAAMTDGHPDVAERAVHLIIEQATGPFHRPYAVVFGGIDTLLLDQFSSDYRAEIGPARLDDLVEEDLLPPSDVLAQLITHDPRWSAILVDVVRALILNKLMELEADPDLTHEENVRLIGSRLR